ncbi:MAG: tryptophan--tRNA ligase [Candidatus Kerfeldbacteria bacterium CG08_land_8_20_14_0_20_42_7]|uniref:Tryptophan--tRNA ligase n=1 Tax=Candidatus Kerfeldbacteria bacterium CG08_land_8_20_14_0_20_42_7 TaxID=2014245 RepID=A0A2H0YTY4_9BACT|nr:MAG: tryptophan--tRNA ligase [Candidatus Kerfeldbacteria bacterium CG08_land_8_20_14_0_20_42_7]
MNKKPRIVSGIQPSGKLHIGNYLGAVRQFIELQDSGLYDCFFFIADLHSLSENYDPAQKQRDVYDLLASLLALGLNPDKSTIFLQSQIIGHTDLGWLFATVMPIAELKRMTQYKDKAGRQKNNINAALLTYPLLQAADVLIYNGELVPVGQDQEQHIELIRVVAKKMNTKFKTSFPESKPLFTKTPKIMSLRDPQKKMSKSLGDAHVLNIFDEPDVIRKKLQKAITGNDAKSTDAKGFLELYAQFIGKPDGQFSDMKKNLAERIILTFNDARKQYTALLTQQTALDKILDKGRARAQPIATETLNQTKQKMGLL